MTSTVVVTGMGVVAPTGIGVDEHWAATLRGTCAIDRVSRFDPTPYRSTLAAEVPGFVPEEHLPSRLIPQTDHMTRLALVAADQALQNADLDVPSLPEFGVGVVTASSAGGFDFGHRELEKLWSKGPEHVSAYQSFAWFYAVNTGQISIRHGLRGPSGVLVTEQAGGLDALAQARRQVRQGTRAMIGGGVDGSLCAWGWVAQQTGGRLSTAQAPDRAYLPFDAGACGQVPGEGGALLVLESADDARARGAEVYGALLGYAATFDPPPGSAGPSTLRRAAELALRDAGVEARDIDVVFADAAGLPDLDRAEAQTLAEVFGGCAVPVTAPKTMTGRLAAGGASLDVATALLAIRHGVIPPTVNVTRPLPDYRLDLVTRPRRATLSAALVLARGHGGFNAAMVVGRERR
ncbi:actinorhodin polyketide putative beta-ketoacyl synthase 2 [Streptomyces nigrescens]|uniref:Ketosynthase chain-length factor n=2 Tax=Streptomyces TaxID=1883 RepID=A0ABU7NS49_9ACTN|nr:ketosynthase chain-length factor [Streptomyces nigrescens]MEE4421618.1 ketosynthase chain-length factor [Streptomyces sp. DSM 41528]BDM71267.1 actinorhodin polyketide putative beta-ketoacyl synthase 2 [Streptomyces nigrescens]